MYASWGMEEKEVFIDFVPRRRLRRLLARTAGRYVRHTAVSRAHYLHPHSRSRSPALFHLLNL